MTRRSWGWAAVWLLALTACGPEDSGEDPCDVQPEGAACVSAWVETCSSQPSQPDCEAVPATTPGMAPIYRCSWVETRRFVDAETCEEVEPGGSCVATHLVGDGCPTTRWVREHEGLHEFTDRIGCGDEPLADWIGCPTTPGGDPSPDQQACACVP